MTIHMFDPEFMNRIETVIRNVISDELAKARHKQEPLMTKKAICKKLSISFTTFEVIRKMKEVPSHAIGHRIFYKESEVREVIRDSSTNKIKYVLT